MRNSIDVVSSLSTATTRRKLWQIDVVDRTAKIDHAIDGVNSHGSQAAARSLVAMRAPLRGLKRQRVGKCHVRFDVQDGSEPATADTFAKLRHFGMEAAVVSQTQRHSSFACGLDGRFRVAL